MSAETADFRGNRNTKPATHNPYNLCFPIAIMKTDGITVIKETGESEPFNPRKVREALGRSGLRGREADRLIEQLEQELYDGITTKKIYSMVSKKLKSMKPEIRHRYNLKRALLDLGPAGYDFEEFIGKLLVCEGYSTQLRRKIEGNCVTHEIDVVASRNKSRYMVECKFHNEAGMRCKIQSILYIYSRFLDLQEGSRKGKCEQFSKPWLITNTKFSEDVIRYAECMEIPLLGWRYPFRYSLEAMIDKHRCYPVTVIPMNKDARTRMLSRKLITVSDIPESPHKLSSITGMPLKKAERITEQAEYAR